MNLQKQIQTWQQTHFHLLKVRLLSYAFNTPPTVREIRLRILGKLSPMIEKTLISDFLWRCGASFSAVYSQEKRGAWRDLFSCWVFNEIGFFETFYRFSIRKSRWFERPTLRGCHWILDSWQRWRFASTLPCQKTNPDGVIGGQKCAIVGRFW